MLSFKRLDNFLVWGIKGALFLIPCLPLYVTPSMAFPYITGKNFAFRILVEFAAALWLGLIVSNKEYRLRNSPITISILIFTFIVGLADLFGVSPYNSFWSNYERMEGYITILHLALYFLIMKSVMCTKKDWIVLFNIFVMISFLVSINALIIHPMVYKSPQFVMEYGQRIYGTLGNPPFLASYLLLSDFFGFILIFNTQRTFLKYFYLLPIVINTIVIFYTASRGAILAAIIGVIIFILFSILGQTNTPNEKRIKKAGRAVIGVLIVLSILFINYRNTDFIKDDSTLSRFASMFSDASVQVRFNAWSLAWEGIKERPFLGWGQENFIGIFTVNPIPLVHEQVWVDRAHNIIIDWAINAGFIGLLSYLGIFGAVFYVLRREYQNKGISKNRAVIVVTALAVYLFHNLFTFDTINTYVLFFTFLAYIVNIDYRKGDSTAKEVIDLRKINIKSLLVILPSIVVFSFAFYYLNYKPIKESQLSVRISSSSNNNKSYLNLLKDFNNALSLNSFGDSLVRQGMKAISFYILQEELIGQKGALEFIAKTVEELEKGIAENSYNLEYLTDVINIYTRIAKYEEYFIEYTEALINKCLRLNPQYDRLYFMLADILVLKKDFNKAVEVASNIAARGPDNDITYFELALIAIRSSNDEVASNALEKVKAIRMAAYDYTVADGDTVFSVGELRRMAQVYLESNKLHEAIHLYKLVLTYLQDDGPAAARLHFKMANIYHIIGDSENTIKEIKKAAELDPDNYAEEAERIIYSLNK